MWYGKNCILLLMMLFIPLCWRVLFSPDEPEVTPEARSRDVWCDPIPGDVTCQCQTVSVTHQPLHFSWLISTHHFIIVHTRELELVSRGDTRQDNSTKKAQVSDCLSVQDKQSTQALREHYESNQRALSNREIIALKTKSFSRSLLGTSSCF